MFPKMFFSVIWGRCYRTDLFSSVHVSDDIKKKRAQTSRLTAANYSWLVDRVCQQDVDTAQTPNGVTSARWPPFCVCERFCLCFCTNKGGSGSTSSIFIDRLWWRSAGCWSLDWLCVLSRQFIDGRSSYLGSTRLLICGQITRSGRRLFGLCGKRQGENSTSGMCQLLCELQSRPFSHFHL